MKKLTQIIESKYKRLSASSVKILKKEISDFNAKMCNKLPEEIVLLSNILNKYQILDSEIVRDIVSSTKTEQRRIINELGINQNDADDIFMLIKKIERDGNTRLIPQLMSQSEREALETGRKALDDITMDLETERGREAVAKVYMKVVYKIAGQFKGKSSLDDAQLISAGAMGLMNAMLNYRKPETNDIDSLNIPDEDKREGQKLKGLSFRQYAGWRIRQQILDDINNYGRTVRLSAYAYDKLKRDDRIKDSFNVSLSGLDADETSDRLERMGELGVEPEAYRVDKTKESERIKELCKIIEDKFPMKDATVFYRIFGINGHKKETARTIASEIGVTEVRIAQIKRNVINYLRSHPKAMDILSDLLQIYTESLLCDIYNLGREQIYETLISDDMFMMLEAVTRWDSKSRLEDSMRSVLDSLNDVEADYIVQCMQEGFDFIDSSYRKNKPLIVKFLSLMEPTDTFTRRSDAYILDKMAELSQMCQKYGVYAKK